MFDDYEIQESLLDGDFSCKTTEDWGTINKIKHSWGWIYQENGVSVLVAEGEGWATIYTVESGIPDKGYCQQLLLKLKEIYKDVDFGCTVALNPKMNHILEKLQIKEYV